jgi:cell division protein DivIC
MKSFLEKFNQLPWYIKNPYFFVSLFFVVWMLFFDTNNFFYQMKLNRKISVLEDQKDYYAEQIDKVYVLKDELFSNDIKKEKFAREKYFMKKDNEDVFIIVQEE